LGLGIGPRQEFLGSLHRKTQRGEQLADVSRMIAHAKFLADNFANH
jgi:hypothetical protein